MILHEWEYKKISWWLWSFLDLQKIFDTADHQILSEKLNQYRTSGVSNESYLSNCNQYVSMSRYGSGLTAINHFSKLLTKRN